MTSIEAGTLYGTLSLLLLRTIAGEEMHGLEVRRRIEEIAGEPLRIEEGALYPALHRLERAGLLSSRWGKSERGRRAKFYQLTPKGVKRLEQERAHWMMHVRAVARVILEPGEVL